MNREHPTGTERKSLNYECGWKGGDRGGLAGRKKFAERKKCGKEQKTIDRGRPSHGRSSLIVLTYFGVSGNSYSFKCFTTSAEISNAVFFTVFSGAFFSMTNFAAAT